MKFVVITHVEHCLMDGKIYGYGPYIKEMNLWFKYVDEVIIVAPVSQKTPSKIDLAYIHQNLRLVPIPTISLTSISEILRALFLLPVIKWKIFSVMRKADHLHLRCPGNIGLIGSILQIIFPFKNKTAKYAGNWDPNAKQPLSYKIQKWILANTFLTRNMQVLVYGEWPNQSNNIKSFFTATYNKNVERSQPMRDFTEPFGFIFVGSLTAGKRPLYALKLVETLYLKGIDCTLDIYGEGVERPHVEHYINSNNLSERIHLHGNQTSELIETAYKESHFLLLPSKSEGWPKVVAEAMFWGAIPIVTPISCVPWMLGKGERGLFIDVDLQNDCEAILSVLKSPAKLKKMSFEGTKWSQHYTVESFEASIAKLIGR